MKRCLPVAKWNVTAAHIVARNECIGRHARDLSRHLSFSCCMKDAVDFIASCCRFFVDLFIFVSE
jgi:hypothetical protein